MFDRPESGENAIIVSLELPGRVLSDDLAELEELLRAAGASVVASVTGSRQTPEPRYYVGTGKAEEIRATVEHSGADVVVVNHELSPAQERNLERLIQCRVLDRSGLILDIFAQRARTAEGKLQVELAQLQHLSTRLVRGWTHLERQKGGIGLRGPGESQLETDRRLIGQRIRQLNTRLEKIRARRARSQRSRKRADCFTVSLVGYTNAGKSTLFNALTGASEFAADQLFATLDTKHRRLSLSSALPVVLSDTVGFINRLPHELVAAFHATLETVRESDLLLHVIDAADEERAQRITDVLEVLAEIGAESVSRIEVYNKLDLLEPGRGLPPDSGSEAARRIAVSAVTGAGLEILSDCIVEQAQANASRYRLTVPVSCARERARLYESGVVLSESLRENGDWILEARLDAKQLSQLSSRLGIERLDPDSASLACAS